MKKIISALFGMLLVFSLNASVANAAAKEVRIAFFLEWASPNQEDKVKKHSTRLLVFQLNGQILPLEVK